MNQKFSLPKAANIEGQALGRSELFPMTRIKAKLKGGKTSQANGAEVYAFLPMLREGLAALAIPGKQPTVEESMGDSLKAPAGDPVLDGSHSALNDFPQSKEAALKINNNEIEARQQKVVRSVLSGIAIRGDFTDKIKFQPKNHWDNMGDPPQDIALPENEKELFSGVAQQLLRKREVTSGVQLSDSSQIIGYPLPSSLSGKDRIISGKKLAIGAPVNEDQLDGIFKLIGDALKNRGFNNDEIGNILSGVEVREISGMKKEGKTPIETQIIPDILLSVNERNTTNDIDNMSEAPAKLLKDPSQLSFSAEYLVPLKEVSTKHPDILPIDKKIQEKGIMQNQLEPNAGDKQEPETKMVEREKPAAPIIPKIREESGDFISDNVAVLRDHVKADTVILNKGSIPLEPSFFQEIAVAAKGNHSSDMAKNDKLALDSLSLKEISQRRPDGFPAADKIRESGFYVKLGEPLTIDKGEFEATLMERDNQAAAFFPKIREEWNKMISGDLPVSKDHIRNDNEVVGEGKVLSSEPSVVFGQTDISSRGNDCGVIKMENSPVIEKGVIPEQMADQLTQILSKGGGRIRMILSPPHLGSIDVDVSLRGNDVQIVMVAGTRDIHQVLQTHVDQLKEGLLQQGMQADGFQILFGNDQRSPEGGAGGWNAWRRESSGADGNKKEQKEKALPLVIHSLAERRNLGGIGDGISIVV